MAFPYSWANNLLMEYNLCHRWSGCWHADPDPTTNVLVSTLACPKLIWYSVTDYRVWKARNDKFLGGYFSDFRACLQTFGGPDQGAQALAFIRVLSEFQTQLRVLHTERVIWSLIKLSSRNNTWNENFPSTLHPTRPQMLICLAQSIFSQCQIVCVLWEGTNTEYIIHWYDLRTHW